MINILVAEDEFYIANLIKISLEQAGYNCMLAEDGEQALKLVEEQEFDLVLLDIMMPKISGVDVCMKVREFSTVPIIMLTAKSEDSDKLMGFESGADDYITKPFNILELRARIRALLRRSAISDQKPKSNITVFKNITVDSDRKMVEKDGKYVELTSKEFDIIELFVKNPGKVYSRESLLDLIWGYDYQGDIRTVDVHVHRLRDKLEGNPSGPGLIVTKWGVGYYLRP